MSHLTSSYPSSPRKREHQDPGDRRSGSKVGLCKTGGCAHLKGVDYSGWCDTLSGACPGVEHSLPRLLAVLFPSPTQVPPQELPLAERSYHGSSPRAAHIRWLIDMGYIFPIQALGRANPAAEALLRLSRQLQQTQFSLCPNTLAPLPHRGGS